LATIPERRGQNPFDEMALRVRVVLLAASHGQLPFQLVVGRRGLRMSAKIVAKREVANPELAALDDAVQVIRA